jgi:hypothetical protein
MSTVGPPHGPVSHAGTAASRRVTRWLLATIALVVLAYRPVLDMSFVGDDFMILHYLRQADGLRYPGTYFQLNFFGYYRPLAFLSYALDWQLWHGRAMGFHLSSLFLHAANVALVFALGKRLFGHVPAIVAALLFAIHPSNHEAVFWMSSRFDLLATFLMLVGLAAMLDGRVSRPPGDGRPAGRAFRFAAGAACFALALLSKESAFAFPLIVLAGDVFLARRSACQALGRLVPVLAIMAVYMAVRTGAGGAELGEGLARVAKVLFLCGGLAGLVWLASRGADLWLGQLAFWRARLAVAFGVLLAGSLAASLLPWTMGWMRAKLAFASFAGLYLLSPVITLGGSASPTFDPRDPIFWLSGWMLLAAVALLLVFAWRPDTGWAGARPARNAEFAFLLVFVAAALLPVSSMTEGKRYLYLASAGIALTAGWAVGRLGVRARTFALGALGVVVAVSGWQIRLKAQDWAWAGAMTAGAVQVVRTLDPDPCRARNVLFLTAPVGVRDVYSHFYDYTFEDPATRCLPQSVRTLVRVVGHDVGVTAAWTGPHSLVFTARGAVDRLVTSTDLRHFDVPLWPPARRHLVLPVGTLDVAAVEGGLRFEVRFSDAFDPSRWQVLFFGAGRVEALPAPRWLMSAAPAR